MSEKEALQARQQQMLLGLSTEEDSYNQFLQQLKPEKRQRITRSLASMKHGLHAVAPLTCQGPTRCPFINHCPIPTVAEKQEQVYGDISSYPMMMPCVLETMYQRQKIIEYVQYLEVDPENPIEVAIVNELAIIDLHKNRALMIQSEGDRDGDGRDFLRQDETYAQVGDGAELVKSTSLHPIFEVLDRLEKRRERLIERLVETRASKANMDLKRGAVYEDSDVLKEIAAVRRFLEEGSKISTTSKVGDMDAIMLDDD